jgi:hypothetical protein
MRTGTGRTEPSGGFPGGRVYNSGCAGVAAVRHRARHDDRARVPLVVPHVQRLLPALHERGRHGHGAELDPGRPVASVRDRCHRCECFPNPLRGSPRGRGWRNAPASAHPAAQLVVSAPPSRIRSPLAPSSTGGWLCVDPAPAGGRIPCPPPPPTPSSSHTRVVRSLPWLNCQRVHSAPAVALPAPRTRSRPLYFTRQMTFTLYRLLVLCVRVWLAGAPRPVWRSRQRPPAVLGAGPVGGHAHRRHHAGHHHGNHRTPPGTQWGVDVRAQLRVPPLGALPWVGPPMIGHIQHPAHAGLQCAHKIAGARTSPPAPPPLIRFEQPSPCPPPPPATPPLPCTCQGHFELRLCTDASALTQSCLNQVLLTATRPSDSTHPLDPAYPGACTLGRPARVDVGLVLRGACARRPCAATVARLRVCRICVFLLHLRVRLDVACRAGGAERWFLPPAAAYTTTTFTAHFLLPAGITCTNCVLQVRDGWPPSQCH